jgi:chromosome segregation ATPase
MKNIASDSEAEKTSLKLQLIDYHATENELKDKIKSLEEENFSLSKRIEEGEKGYDELMGRFQHTKDELNDRITNLEEELISANQEVEYTLYENNELKQTEEQLISCIQDQKDQIRSFQSTVNSLESEISDLNIQVSELQDLIETQQQTLIVQSK